MDERTAYESVSAALELGYRHVDTAQTHGNERAVGRTMADADVDRADVHLAENPDVFDFRLSRAQHDHRKTGVAVVRGTHGI